MHEQQSTRTFLVPAEDYKEIVNRLDETTLRHAYLGRWASREAFGLHLLGDTSAERRLAELPGWLRGFVRLDGDAFAADLEHEGVYVYIPVDEGLHVFDAAAVRPRQER